MSAIYIDHDGEKIPHHVKTVGVHVTHDGQARPHPSCWCEISMLYKGQDLLCESIAVKSNKGPLQCYYVANIPSDIPINRIISDAIKKEVRGPVFLRFAEEDLDPKEIVTLLKTR